MAPTTPDPVADLRSRLKRCGRRIAKHVEALEGDGDDPGLYDERNDLYMLGIGLGVRKVDLAKWAGSTPDAVAKAIKKLEDD